MRVLIVDGFGESAEERRLNQEFARGCMKALKQIDVGGIKIHWADAKSVGQYVFNNKDPKCGTQGLNKFDKTDIVFVGCDFRFMPWTKKYEDLLTLLKMCWVTNKCVFGSSALAHIMGFLCATGGISVNPLNGNGSTLDSFDAKMYAPMVRVGTRDVFFDNENGDLYSYNKYDARWVPYTNVGFMHKRQTNKAGKKHISRPVVKNDLDLIIGKQNEQVCRVGQIHTESYLFKGLSREFVVRSRPQMMLNAAANLRSHHRYDVLAEGPFAPLIVSYRNMVACHFDISAEYPETLELISNFVHHYAGKISQHSSLDLSAQLYLAYQSQTARPEAPLPVPPQQQLRQRPMSAKKASRPEAAQASQCLFVNLPKQEYVLKRSTKKLQERMRTEDRRPKSAYSPKSNYAISKSQALGQQFKQEIDVGLYATRRRIQRAKKKRDAEVTFTKPIARPRSAPSHLVRSCNRNELRDSLFQPISQDPIYDKFNPETIAKQSLDLHKSTLTSTHNLRIFNISNNKNKSSTQNQNQISSMMGEHQLSASMNSLLGFEHLEENRSDSDSDFDDDRHYAEASSSKKRPPKIRVGQQRRKVKTATKKFATPPSRGFIHSDAGPYKSTYERERADFLEGKKKWISSNVYNPYTNKHGTTKL